MTLLRAYSLAARLSGATDRSVETVWLAVHSWSNAVWDTDTRARHLYRAIGEMRDAWGTRRHSYIRWRGRKVASAMMHAAKVNA